MAWFDEDLTQHRCKFCGQFIAKGDCLEHDWREPGHDFRLEFGFCCHDGYSFDIYGKCPAAESLMTTLGLLAVIRDREFP
jgi:hypothetical protein